MEELLNKFSIEELEKLKIISSFCHDKTKKNNISLEAFSDEYCRLIKNKLSKSYSVSVKISLDYLIEFFGKHKSLQDLACREYENFIVYLSEKVKRGYRVYVRNINAALNKAIEWEYLEINYLQRVKLAKKQAINPTFINSEQLVIICNFINSQVIKDIAVVGFNTGMRLNELMNLTIRDVDYTKRIITVGSEDFTTKGRNQRHIPISDEAFEVLKRRRKIIEEAALASKVRKVENNNIFVLRRLKEENELSVSISKALLFTKENGISYCSSYVSKCFKKACLKASKDEKNKIDKAIHFHSLRHSFASKLVQEDVPLYTVKELLGHSTIATTEIYSHLNIDALRQAVKVFDEKNINTPVSSAQKHSEQFANKGETKKVKIYKLKSGY